MLRRLSVAAALLVCIISGAAPVLAHAVLVESSPADGAVLAQPPAEIRLQFNEPVSAVAVQVLTPTGEVLPVDEPTAEDAVLRIALPDSLAPGTYLVSYRVRSLDAHPVAGSIAFAVGAADAEPGQAAVSDRPSGWLIAYGVNRVLFYAALTLSCGASFFLALVLAGHQAPCRAASRAIVKLVRAAGGAAVLLTITGVVLKGATLTAPSLGGLIREATWKAGAETTLGPSAALAAVALLVMSALAGAGRRRAIAAAVAAVAAAASFTLTGHAATAAPRWLMGPALGVHVLVAAFWTGALACLLIALRHCAAGEAAAVLKRFSALAVPAVTLLLAAAAVLAVVQVGEIAALCATDYGMALLAKIALVVCLLAVAMYNKTRLTPRVRAGATAAPATLRGTIRVELVLVAAIFAATAVLGSVPPPRAQQPAQQAIALTGQSRGSTAHIELRPGEAGANDVLIRLAGADGAPIEAQSLHVVAGNRGAGIAPISRPGERIERGVYAVRGLPLAVGGAWTLRVEVLVSDFDKLIFEVAAEIR